MYFKQRIPLMALHEHSGHLNSQPLDVENTFNHLAAQLDCLWCV